MIPKKPIKKEGEEKQKKDLGENLIVIFGFILVALNFVLLAISYSSFFFMFKYIGFFGYLLLTFTFILRGFFPLIVFALSLIYLKKIKGLFFVVAIYNVLLFTLINPFSEIFRLRFDEIFSLRFFEIILVLILFPYFIISCTYLLYKKIRRKNEEKK